MKKRKRRGEIPMKTMIVMMTSALTEILIGRTLVKERRARVHFVELTKKQLT
jgi:hypothetical protein